MNVWGEKKRIMPLLAVRKKEPKKKVEKKIA
jgi:hypothetical protein